MKILSIDLDFISAPAINRMNSKEYESEIARINQLEEQPVIKWRQIQDVNSEEFKNICNQIDIENYQFCLRLFLRAFNQCQDVRFGYDHDAILFGLEGHTDIEVVNIDHHSDILSGSTDEQVEMYWIDKEERVTEGNWGYYLHSQGRLKSWHWILNLHSEEFTDTLLGDHLFGDKFSWSFREDYDFGNYEFDQIFVCLSPSYIPPLHWHMLGTFVRVYEELSGKKIEVDYLHRKYEMEKYYKGVTNIIYPEPTESTSIDANKLS